jgi:tight adherence protein B
MRRYWLLLAAGLCAAVAATSATGAQSVRLTEAGGAKFPVRAYVLSLRSQHRLSAEDLKVTENGNPVVDPTLVPAASAAGKTFGVVLVVDSSLSMRGKPLAGAMAASRAFAARRNATQRLAFVTFNNKSTVVVPLTTSKPEIDANLSTTPEVAYGTHIYDAVTRAVLMLKAAKIDSGSVVLLSDGADVGSTATKASVLRAARNAHVRIYTIGLRSGSFSPETLQALAAGGGGEYALAKTPKELVPLFNSLGAELAREYVLEYKSLAGPEEKVDVKVVVDGLGTVESAYQTPALPVTVVPPYKKSLTSRFWSSIVLMVLVALLVAGLLLLGVLAVLPQRNKALRARMGEFVTLSDPGSVTTTRPSAITAPQGEREETRGGWNFWRRFEEECEIADIKTTPTRIAIWTLVGTVAVALLLDLILGSAWWSLFALLVPIAVRSGVSQKLERKRRRFAEQLPDGLQVMASALRAGHSFAGSLAVVVDTSAEPMKGEMQRVVAEEQLGVPLEDSLTTVARRMENRDLEQVALVAKLQREAVGNVAEVIDRVVETVRERFELRRLVRTLTAQGRASRWIVSLLPLALLVLISLANPHYLHPLFSHTLGIVMLAVAGVMVLLGSYAIKRIVEIKV